MNGASRSVKATDARFRGSLAEEGVTVMGLDITILTQEGRPGRSVSLSQEGHARLIRTAAEVGAKQILRMRNYYEDATFAPEEVAEIVDELKLILNALSKDERMLRVCREILMLSDEALVEGKNLEVIAD